MALIRLSQPADPPVLTGIRRRSVRATHDFLPEQDFLEIERIVAERYIPHPPLWVTAPEGLPAGFMGLTGAHVDALFIDPARRAQGLGRALLDHAAALAGKLSVDVNAQNAQAVGFYERMGLRRTGRSPTDDAGRPYPLLHMGQH